MNGDQQPCPRCHGTGIVSVQHGPVYAIDSEEEMMLAFHEEPCPVCSRDWARGGITIQSPGDR